MYRHIKLGAIGLVLALILPMGFLISALSGTAAYANTTIYIGKMGFDADTILNDDLYKQGFNTYFGAHLMDDLIVSLDLGTGNNIIFDANAYLNATGYKNVVEFANDNPATAPLDAIIWNGISDIMPPSLKSVSYTLNGIPYNISSNYNNIYQVEIFQESNNELSNLIIVVKEQSPTTLSVTDTNINLVNIKKMLDDAGLSELIPQDGHIIIDLNSLSKLLSYIDFTVYSIGTKKYIDFSLTDEYGNCTLFRLNVLVVAA